MYHILVVYVRMILERPREGYLSIPCASLWQIGVEFSGIVAYETCGKGREGLRDANVG